MVQSGAGFSLPLAILGLALMAWRGIHLIRGGRLRKDSWEYNNAVGLVNIVNMLRRRPLQEHLTDPQMRAIGIDYSPFAHF